MVKVAISPAVTETVQLELDTEVTAAVGVQMDKTNRAN